MIGIDITDWSRFAEMPDSKRQQIAQRYKHNYTDARQLAKWWACHEAVIKCLARSPNWLESRIEFPENSPPQYIGPETISLSLSHERNIIVAVALCLKS